MSSLASRGRSRGFSLLEVMVSVIVICVGLLGIAKLQALALSNTTTSRLRALAAIQAASMASSMHSNREYWGNPPNTVTLTGTTITSSDAALQSAAGTANAGTLCIGTSGSGSACQAVPLAAFDLVRWSNSLATLLPNPAATISCPSIPGGGPASCTITVNWSEKAVAINTQEANAAANAQFESPSYTLYVEP